MVVLCRQLLRSSLSGFPRPSILVECAGGFLHFDKAGFASEFPGVRWSATTPVQDV